MTESKKTQTILVTGADGQLGSELQRASPSFPQYQFLFTNSAQLDISKNDAVLSYFTEHEIDYCINCAAFTAVDKAETERERALAVNAAGPQYLAAACRQSHAKLIHISTDYVFNGRGKFPYKPDDHTDPVNYYGSTKLAGEQKAQAENPETIIVRTAWVYSSFGNNFLKTMMRLMREKESIKVVADQHGTPTYAGDLATALMKIISGGVFIPGIYHYSNAGETTWYEFAKEIARLLSTTCEVKPIPSSQYPTPAARPLYSVLDTSSAVATFHVASPPWEQSLAKCISLLR